MKPKKTFYQLFKENMEALHLPAPPESLAGSSVQAYGLIRALTEVVDKFGPAVTVSQLIGAGLLSEKLAYAGALGVAFYLGACIGSLAVATGEKLADEIAFSQPGSYPFALAENMLHRNGLYVPKALMETKYRPFPDGNVDWASSSYAFRRTPHTGDLT